MYSCGSEESRFAIIQRLIIVAAFIYARPRAKLCSVARAALINDLSSAVFRVYALSRVYVYAGLPPGARGQGMHRYNYVLLP